MTKPAVIAADYYNFEYKKGLKVCRLTFEVPYEHAKHVRDVLGDPPLPGEQVRVAIARLVEPKEDSGPKSGASSESSAPLAAPLIQEGQGSDKPRHFRDMPRSQQAALKCNDPEFRRWLEGHRTADWNAVYEVESTNEAACDRTIKRVLSVLSKKDLDRWPEAGANWDKLLTDFEYRNQVRK